MLLKAGDYLINVQINRNFVSVYSHEDYKGVIVSL